ncbi:MAG: protein-glutamate methylesterase/protein-glutamine glutaminase [Alphaproteobacteria bacterium]
MVVDDSAVVRGLTTRILQEDESIKVVASVGNGEMAVRNLPRQDVDVIVLDIEMPVMDGLTALPKLLEVDPTVRVLMSSTLTSRNAEISMKALEAGASDYIPKPTSSVDISQGGDFRRELHDKVFSLGSARRRSLGAKRAAVTPKPTVGAAPIKAAPPKRMSTSSEQIKLRSAGTLNPDVLVVGSSTGGPQALLAFFKGLNANLNLPVMITQHMPPSFTAILAEHITKQTGWACAEGKTGDILQPGRAYLAPGDFHMLVDNNDGKRVIRLDQGPAESFCRPAVDPMLRSVVKSFGGNVIVVILTGMGADGRKGGEVIVEAGGTIIAQDEATSVVWGMPGAVATAGLCCAVLPLNELSSYVENFVTRRTS